MTQVWERVQDEVTPQPDERAEHVDDAVEDRQIGRDVMGWRFR